jgi:predicted PurR-regulated permease PerM
MEPERRDANPQSFEVQAAGVPALQPNVFVTGLALVATLYFGRTIFVPLALAVMLTFLLAPPVRLLRSWHFGRVPSVVVVVLLAFTVIFGLGAVLGEQVAQLAEKLPQYEITIGAKVRTFQGAANATLEQAFTILNNLREEIAAPIKAPESAAGKSGDNAGSVLAPVPVEIRQPELGPLQMLERVLDPLLGPLTTTGIIIIFVIFILLQREDLRDRLIKLAGSHDLHRTTAAIDDAAQRLSRYFLAQTALNAVFGVVVGVGLALIGVPSPVLWGILAMILRFVPYIGAFIAAAFPLALAAAVDPGWTKVLWTLGLFLVIEPITGQVIEPMLYGQSTGISPVAVVVAATFWTWLWGPIGLLLSTPLTVCLGVIGRHVDRLQFLDVLFGDRPPLSPAQSFYQRTLAGDADEAVLQAEAILKEKSLSRYYDEVAMQGLRLAQIDFKRGLLKDRLLVQIKNAVDELVEDLDDYDDVEPNAPPASVVGDGDTVPKPAVAPVVVGDDLRPEFQHEASVLCVFGRSPLDAAAGAMLVQLLTKHGVRARLEHLDALFSSHLSSLENREVRMVCITQLDGAGGGARLRHAIRRLRRRFPTATILAGMWGEASSDLGADLYAASLREAVGMCVLSATRAPELPVVAEPVAAA